MSERKTANPEPKRFKSKPSEDACCTVDRLAVIKERWSKVTQGTWAMVRGPMGCVPQPKPLEDGCLRGVTSGAAASVFAQNERGHVVVAPNIYTENDALAIVNARADIAYLVKRMEELEAVLARAQDLLTPTQVALLGMLHHYGPMDIQSLASMAFSTVEEIEGDVERLVQVGDVRRDGTSLRTRGSS